MPGVTVNPVIYCDFTMKNNPMTNHLHFFGMVTAPAKTSVFIRNKDLPPRLTIQKDSPVVPISRYPY